MRAKSKFTAIILASGSGVRFKGDLPKQFAKLAGLPVIIHTLKAFQFNKSIAEIVLVTRQEYVEELWGLAGRNQLSKVKKIVVGGGSRQESSMIGISACGEDTGYVLIHDAVRPFVSQTIIDDLVKAAIKQRAVDTVIASADTIVEINKAHFIEKIPDRSVLRRGQTPQAFEYKLIREAHKKALEAGIDNSTDDCSLVLRLGYPVYTVPGDDENIKITYPLDLQIADKLFQMKRHKIKEATSKKDIQSLKEMVFIVIGGTSGIGKAISDELRKYGARIYALSRKSSPSFDVTDPVSIARTFKSIWRNESRVDCVINSAGLLIRREVEFMEVDEWDEIYNTNIKGAFLVAKGAIPYLKRQNSGSIIFLGSSSYTRGRRGYAAYSSSKAALVNYCQALAEELLDYNIRVNVLSPSRVDTPMRRKTFGNEDPKSLLSSEDIAKECLKIIFTETTGSVFDVA